MKALDMVVEMVMIYDMDALTKINSHLDHMVY